MLNEKRQVLIQINFLLGNWGNFVSRRKSRILAFQALYSWDASNEPVESLLQFSWVESKDSMEGEAFDFGASAKEYQPVFSVSEEEIGKNPDLKLSIENDEDIEEFEDSYEEELEVLEEKAKPIKKKKPIKIL